MLKTIKTIVVFTFILNYNLGISVCFVPFQKYLQTTAAAFLPNDKFPTVFQEPALIPSWEAVSFEHLVCAAAVSLGSWSCVPNTILNMAFV